ncbi:protein phosphatase 2C domain-containing protein [Cryobacterium sp. PH29-G1]|uniref:PP2C family protein-serine/threonine phosphatase n=1 Tax=Cryobacterium sp. PH29-G1 TaxID=3046211 RepID=UPI0024BB49E3|nr:protein phosphatase 2C domain-containing protein [Cryobacterium sp. PH29-G1]MDJ0347739.1 protein phosphatase 2C domain-containing protein [Cryobacterium sp. PH29-G1]
MSEAAERRSTSSGVSLRCGFRTDVGHKRNENEDSLLAEAPVFIVADGMGGLEAGHRASAAVIAEFQSCVARSGVPAGDVVAAVERAHTGVGAVSDSTVRGAGSTLTGVVLIDHEDSPQWLIMNVGDSRVYRLHGGEFHQLTVDHSLAQELIDAGSLLKADIATFARKNVITRAMGAQNSTADYWLRPVITGERLLVCSDGLSGELSDEAIKAGLTLGGTTQQTADLLLAGALEHGGRDNISLIVIDVIAGGVGSWHGISFDGDDQSDTIDTRNDDTRPVKRGGRNAAE